MLDLLCCSAMQLKNCRCLSVIVSVLRCTCDLANYYFFTYSSVSVVLGNISFINTNNDEHFKIQMVFKSNPQFFNPQFFSYKLDMIR